jgi:hypothetical protein
VRYPDEKIAPEKGFGKAKFLVFLLQVYTNTIASFLQSIRPHFGKRKKE